MDIQAEKISDAELEIMKVVWRSPVPMTYPQIRSALEGSADWDSSTIRTLIRRLVEKGALSQSKEDVYCYAPAIGESEFMEQKTQSFLNKVYGGDAKGLVATLFKKDYINKQDIEELKSFWEKEGDSK